MVSLVICAILLYLLIFTKRSIIRFLQICNLFPFSNRNLTGTNYSSYAPFAKRPFGLLRSYTTIFAHKKALPTSLYIQVIPHASMIIT